MRGVCLLGCLSLGAVASESATQVRNAQNGCVMESTTAVFGDCWSPTLSPSQIEALARFMVGQNGQYVVTYTQKQTATGESNDFCKEHRLQLTVVPDAVRPLIGDQNIEGRTVCLVYRVDYERVVKNEAILNGVKIQGFLGEFGVDFITRHQYITEERSSSRGWTYWRKKSTEVRVEVG